MYSTRSTIHSSSELPKYVNEFTKNSAMWKFSRTSSSLRRATQELFVETQDGKYSNKILMIICVILAISVMHLFNLFDLMIPD